MFGPEKLGLVHFDAIFFLIFLLILIYGKGAGKNLGKVWSFIIRGEGEGRGGRKKDDTFPGCFFWHASLRK